MASPALLSRLDAFWLELQDVYRAYAPGILLAGTLALAARYVAATLGGPVMLYALLFGMAFHFLHQTDRVTSGLEFCTRQILRIGVGLLGIRITLDQIGGIGLNAVILVLGGVAITLVAGSWLGRKLRLGKDHAVLSAGAVAICGASAALAISAVLPRHKGSDEQTALTVVGVTTLSTVAMVLYPALTQLLGFNHHQTGIFLGATIHDVAQVIGAGYMISDHSGETATIIKLLRVMCLLPVVIIIGLTFRQDAADSLPQSRSQPPLVPFFMIGFISLLLLNSLVPLPPAIPAILDETSRWCLLAAVAALGVKTSLGDLVKVGPRPIIVLTAQTFLLAAFIFAGICFGLA